MRRYDIVSAILLILSIIDFALAAPVLVQENRQACVDVVHIPEDVITVLGKRGDDGLEKLAEEYLKTWGKPVESSDAHASSSSAPPAPDHGSANVVQAPGPNPASSTANPDPLMEPSGSSSTAPTQDDDELDELLDTLASTGYDSDHELTGPHAPQPNPNKRPSTDPDPVFDWDYWTNLVDPRPSRPAHVSTNVVQAPAPNPASSTANPDPLMEPSSPSSAAPMPGSFEAWDDVSPKKGSDTSLEPMYTPGSSEYDSDHEWAHASNPNPNPRPSTDPDPGFDWNYWMSLDDPLPPRPASPKEIGLPEFQGHMQQPNPGPSTDPDADFDWNHWMSLDDPLAPSPKPVATPKEIGLAPEPQVEHVQQPNPGLSSSASPGPDHESTNVVQSPAPNPASSAANPGPLEEPSSPSSTAPMQVSWDHFNALWDDLWSYKTGAHVPQPNPNPMPSNELDSDRNLMSAHQPEREEETPPSPNLGSPKEPENEVVPGPPPSPDPELQAAAIYAAKGKAKESRHISGTTRDVGNAVQRELQPAERSLDPGVFWFNGGESWQFLNNL